MKRMIILALSLLLEPILAFKGGKYYKMNGDVLKILKLSIVSHKKDFYTLIEKSLHRAWPIDYHDISSVFAASWRMIDSYKHARAAALRPLFISRPFISFGGSNVNKFLHRFLSTTR
jgi:hypothetical protein